MEELVRNIIALSLQLEDADETRFRIKDYIEALHDGRLDYNKEKETMAKKEYERAKTEVNDIINKLRKILEVK